MKTVRQPNMINEAQTFVYPNAFALLLRFNSQPLLIFAVC